MDHWNDVPAVIRHKLLLTLLTGAGCLIISMVFSIVLQDRLLLCLGLEVTAGCLIRGVSLWNIIRSERYETVIGTCIDISFPKLCRYKRITLVDENDTEILLLLDNRANVAAGNRYRFYFQRSGGSLPENEYLKANLSAGSFLGYEKI